MSQDLEILTADTRPTGKKGISWRPSWSFKGPTVDELEPWLADLPGPVVHVCCGPSYIPHETLRVDLEHPSAQLMIDATDLDKHVERASAVFMDPPYAWDLPTRMKAACAAWRCLDRGGLLITHAPWLPRMAGGELESLKVRHEPSWMGWPLPPVMLSVWRKPQAWDPTAHEAEMLRRGKIERQRPESWMWDQTRRDQVESDECRECGGTEGWHCENPPCPVAQAQDDVGVQDE